MTLHIRSCEFSPRPKRADARIKARTREETHRALQNELAEERIDSGRTD